MNLLIAAPVLATGSGPDVAWWRILAALIFCAGLAFASVWFLRRHQGGLAGLLSKDAQSRRMKVIERAVIGPQASATLLSIDGEEWLIVVSTGGTCVRRLRDGEPAPGGEPHL